MGVLMKRVLLTAVLSSAIAACFAAAPVRAQERQCWLDAMSDAQKRDLVLGYARIKQAEGKARADAWAQAQRAAYVRQFAAKGVCPQSRAAERPAPSPSEGARILNRHGKPCKRIELENQNVPNIGGSMGWALVQVCKD
jgi:hypothetical protein